MPTYSDAKIVPAQAGEIEGLTKREYFAALAMQALCNRYNGEHLEEVVRLAVVSADLLIKELNREKK